MGTVESETNAPCLCEVGLCWPLPTGSLFMDQWQEEEGQALLLETPPELRAWARGCAPGQNQTALGGTLGALPPSGSVGKEEAIGP